MWSIYEDIQLLLEPICTGDFLNILDQLEFCSRVEAGAVDHLLPQSGCKSYGVDGFFWWCSISRKRMSYSQTETGSLHPGMSLEWDHTLISDLDLRSSCEFCRTSQIQICFPKKSKKNTPINFLAGKLWLQVKNLCKKALPLIKVIYVFP